MLPFTVVGYYPDNNQPWVAHVMAPNGRQAMHEGLKSLDPNNDPVAVEAFEGHLIGEGGFDTTLERAR
jgi:hypothetical protein